MVGSPRLARWVKPGSSKLEGLSLSQIPVLASDQEARFDRFHDVEPDYYERWFRMVLHTDTLHLSLRAENLHERFYTPDRPIGNAEDFRRWLRRCDTEMATEVRGYAQVAATENPSRFDGRDKRGGWPGLIELQVKTGLKEVTHANHQGIHLIGPKDELEHLPYVSGDWLRHKLIEGHRQESDEVLGLRKALGFSDPRGMHTAYSGAMRGRHGPSESKWLDLDSLPSPRSDASEPDPQWVREGLLTQRLLTLLASTHGVSESRWRNGSIHLKEMNAKYLGVNSSLMMNQTMTHLYDLLRVVHVEKDDDGKPTGYICSSMGEFVSPAISPHGLNGDGGKTILGSNIPLICVPQNMVVGTMQFGDWIAIGMKAIPSENPAPILRAVHGNNGVYDLMPMSEVRPADRAIFVGVSNHTINCPVTEGGEAPYSYRELMHMAVASERVVRTHNVEPTNKFPEPSTTTFIPTYKDKRPAKTLNLAGRKKVRLHDIIRCSTCNGRVEVKASIDNMEVVGKCPHCDEDSVKFPHLVMGADIPKTGHARRM